MVISTHRGLFLFRLNREDGSGELRELSFGYYYGLALYDDYILAARRIDPWSSKVSPTAFELWSRDGLCLGMSQFDGNDIIDCHEISLGKHGLYVCNLGESTLEIRDPITYAKKDTFSFEQGEVPGGLTVNSVYTEGDDFWLLFHNRGQQSFVQHMTHHGSDISFNRRIFIGSGGAHNILYSEPYLYYNASDTGGVHRIDPEDIDTEDWDLKGKMAVKLNQLRQDWHTKGMARVEDLLIVGLSESGQLSHRFKSESHLVFLSMPELEQQFGFKLSHPNGGFIGNINEIRILD